MSIPAEAPTTPGHAQAAAALLAAVRDWHTAHPSPPRVSIRYAITPAGYRALARDSSTDPSRERPTDGNGRIECEHCHCMTPVREDGRYGSHTYIRDGKRCRCRMVGRLPRQTRQEAA